MKFPFTTEQFIHVFNLYNSSIWPIQIIFYLLAAVVIYFTFKPNSYSGIITGTILGFFWVWMGAVYHMMFFSVINKAAIVFGIFFIIQGIVIFYAALQKKMMPVFKLDLQTVLGLGVIIYGIIIYPILSSILGHGYPNGPTFGVPCPTTIFTFGILLLTINFPKHLLVIPALWAFVALNAALSLGIYEDFGLIAACVLTIGVTFVGNRDKRIGILVKS
jgi:hypothetical protein